MIQCISRLNKKIPNFCIKPSDLNDLFKNRKKYIYAGIMKRLVYRVLDLQEITCVDCFICFPV